MVHIYSYINNWMSLLNLISEPRVLYNIIPFIHQIKGTGSPDRIRMFWQKLIVLCLTKNLYWYRHSNFLRGRVKNTGEIIIFFSFLLNFSLSSNCFGESMAAGCMVLVLLCRLGYLFPLAVGFVKGWTEVPIGPLLQPKYNFYLGKAYLRAPTPALNQSLIYNSK